MSGSAQVAGGGGGGDEPTYPSHLKSAHEVDAVVPRRSKPAARSTSGGGPFLCPVCNRSFNAEKAVHGHMRSHPEREWRGMEAPREPSPGELAAPFETREALGGHRASHNGKKGCARRSAAAAAAAAMEAAAGPSNTGGGKRPKHSFDLNDQAPEELPAAAAMEAAAGPSNTGGGKRPKHSFDLNDQAPEELPAAAAMEAAAGSFDLNNPAPEE